MEKEKKFRIPSINPDITEEDININKQKLGCSHAFLPTKESHYHIFKCNLCNKSVTVKENLFLGGLLNA